MRLSQVPTRRYFQLSNFTTYAESFVAWQLNTSEKLPARFRVAHLTGSGDGATTIDLLHAPQTSLQHIPPYEIEHPILTSHEKVGP